MISLVAAALIFPTSVATSQAQDDASPAVKKRPLSEGQVVFLLQKVRRRDNVGVANGPGSSGILEIEEKSSEAPATSSQPGDTPANPFTTFKIDATFGKGAVGDFELVGENVSFDGTKYGKLKVEYKTGNLTFRDGGSSAPEPIAQKAESDSHRAFQGVTMVPLALRSILSVLTTAPDTEVASLTISRPIEEVKPASDDAPFYQEEGNRLVSFFLKYPNEFWHVKLGYVHQNNEWRSVQVLGPYQSASATGTPKFEYSAYYTRHRSPNPAEPLPPRN